MRRKVIQIANSTQLVSLPRKWALAHGIKKGDELDLREDGNKIVISTEQGESVEKVEVDITNLDRDSLMFLIRCLYIKGFDDMHIKFSKATTPHHKIGKDVTVMSSIHQEVNRLNGVEVIQQKENFCLIKDIAEGTIKEFDSVLRRIYLLLGDAANDLLDGIKNDKGHLLETLHEKHDTITKFAAYNLRLLNKFGYPESGKTNSYYYLISALDEIIDILKYASRYVIENKAKLSKDAIAILENINASIQLYFDFFFNYDNKKIEQISMQRTRIVEEIKHFSKKATAQDLFVLTNMEQILEIIIHLVVTRMSLEF